MLGASSVHDITPCAPDIIAQGLHSKAGLEFVHACTNFVQQLMLHIGPYGLVDEQGMGHFMTHGLCDQGLNYKISCMAP